MGAFQLLILLYPPKAKDSPDFLWFEKSFKAMQPWVCRDLAAYHL